MSENICNCGTGRFGYHDVACAIHKGFVPVKTCTCFGPDKDKPCECVKPCQNDKCINFDTDSVGGINCVDGLNYPCRLHTPTLPIESKLRAEVEKLREALNSILCVHVEGVEFMTRREVIDHTTKTCSEGLSPQRSNKGGSRN